jgi:hypothetical protein
LHSGAVNPHDQFLKEGWPIVSFLHTSGCVRAPLGFYLQPINQLSPFLSPSLLLPFPLSLSFLSSPSFFEANNFVPVASFGIHRERTPRDLLFGCERPKSECFNVPRMVQWRRKCTTRLLSSRVCLPVPQKSVRNDTKPKNLVSTMVLDMHIIRPTETHQGKTAIFFIHKKV